MEPKDELIALLALKKAPQIGDVLARRILQELGSATAIFRETKQSLSSIFGIGEVKAGFLENDSLFERARKELQHSTEQGYDIITYTDPLYPERLNYCPDAPILYFQKGSIHWDNPYVLSIVGTRKVTTNGISFLEKLIEELSSFNPIIVSGYAYGVDINAHLLAHKYELQTIGVLAHGLQETYPKKHALYNQKMLDNGGFISEFWHDDPFDRNNFLSRNRIIAGLSEATIVIESAEKGGSLVTADFACSYHREVFALPGRFTDPYSKGCNNLIKQAKAHLINSPSDIGYILGWRKRNTSVQKQLFVELSQEEQEVFDFLKKKDKELLDIIAIELKKPVHVLAATLMSMELKGVIRPLPGKQFSIA
jgi:DNA processing protein